MRDAAFGAAFWLSCAFLMSFVFAACNKYAAAWKITEGAQSAASLATQAMTKRGRDKLNACKKLHKVKTPEMVKCVNPEYTQAKRFRMYGVPLINTGLRLTVASLTIAEKAGSKADWKELVKPAVCALSSVLEEFKAFMPDKAKVAIMAVVSLAKGISCK